MKPKYDRAFYAQYAEESGSSAARVVPHVIELLSPRSVIDVGCGIGTWLAAFLANGVETVLGVDGDYVDRTQLRIPPDRFVPRDLAKPLGLPSTERFDVAVSLEVAEHLPETEARRFVADLAALAPTVVFSAAVPFQGGDHHINEQWPTYWAVLFAEHGYVTVDWLRPRIWGDTGVAYYYAQNTLLFVERSMAERPELAPWVRAPDDPGLCKIHPEKWQEANDPRRTPLRRLVRALPFSLQRAVARRLPLARR